VPETDEIGELDSGVATMIPEWERRPSGRHALPTRGSFQRYKKRRATRLGRSSRVCDQAVEWFLAPEGGTAVCFPPANAQLPFGKQHVVRIQSQDLR